MTSLRVSIFFALGVFLSACSSSSTNNEASDAGASADSSKIADAGNALVEQSCTSIGAYIAACKSDDPCSTAQASACNSGFMASYSDSFQEAVIACMQAPFDCSGGDGGTYYDDCINKTTETVAPTAVQASVKAAYCKACPGSGCDSFFTLYPMSGQGAVVLNSSDAISKEIGDTCLGSDAGAETCPNFFLCALGIQNTTAPAACQ